MLIKKSSPFEIPYSEVTPQSEYLSRRRFLTGTAAAGAGLAAGGAFAFLLGTEAQAQGGRTKLTGVTKSSYSTEEKISSYRDVTTYNNFYEFGTGKDEPEQNARNFKTTPWTVVVEGEAAKPGTYDLDRIMKLAPLEERVYRHRCVEAWSIVVPWIGYPLNALIKLAEPTAKAKYVAFESYYDPKQMPIARRAGLPFPYVEGLRMDEAMHPLALLSVGMYGEILPPQNGAPFRLVVPWKYGFKSIKSIVRIRFQEKEPPTTWNLAASNEYGFYSNVNPNVNHPRWSQATERRLGELFKRDTLPFNGYASQVARLYAGMDLRKFY